MKNNFFVIVSYVSFSLCAVAQHEGCNHGDAPEAAKSGAESPFVQVPKDAQKILEIKTATVEDKQFESILTAFGRVENIPQNVSVATSRIAGRAVEVYARADAFIKKGEPICKIESLLAGNPPPSITLKANSAGIIENLYISKGSAISQNAEIARIADISKLYAVANVFESNLAKLKIGQTARIRIEALGDTNVNGHIVKFGSTVDAKTNTMPVYFEIDNPEGRIKNGMRALFSIVIKAERQAVIIPNSAITSEIGTKYVFVEKCPNDMIFERRHILTGESNDINTEVISGLNKGEKVAVNNVYQLQFMPAAKDEDDGHKEETAKKSSPAIIETQCEHSNVSATHEHKDGEQCAHEHSENDVHAQENADSQISQYTKYFIYCALGISILLNLLFAAAAIGNRRE